MTLPRRLLVLVAGLALVATACTQAVSGNPHGSAPVSPSGSAASSTPATSTGPKPTPSITVPAPEPLAFRDCTAALQSAGVPTPAALKGKLQVGCGQLAVPLDYSHPSNGQIALTVVKFHDTDNKDPIGSLLINPGGPGASGLDFALGFLGELPTSIIQKFDIIGFDPRGVGLSSPITCLTDKQKDTFLATAPDATTAAGFAAAQAQSKQLAELCEQKYGTGLQFYNTVNTARDMDQIRQAVGDKEMNYLGFSYGTELGWVYADLFPDKMRVIVLDGAVDPDTGNIDQYAKQIQGFEDAFDQFADNCKTVSPCDQLSDPRETVQQITTAARAAPLSTSTSGRPLTEGLAYTGVLQALYSKSLWPKLADALISAKNGDGSGLLELADQYNERTADGKYSNILDANTTISCNDSAPGPSLATVRKTATEWAQKYPLFGRWSASGLLSCQSWQPDRTVIPKPDATTPTKVLVVGNIHDPATPYQGAKDLTADLGNAELLTWNGQGHTSYLQGSTCIDNYVNSYLLTQQLPPDETTCPPK
jgi:pimeloyl-ACP methyl ester carboxylesterase